MRRKLAYGKMRIAKPSLMLLMGFLCWVNPSFGDGTKEIFSDRGFYTGEPPGSYCVDLYQWSFYGPEGVEIDANSQGPWGSVEGTKVLRVEAFDHWAGCGVFFLNCDDRTVTDRDFSDYSEGHLRFFLKSTDPVTVEIEFVSVVGDVAKAGVNVASTGDVWQEIVLPLNALRPVVNFSRIRGPFLITLPDTRREKVLFIDHVRWTKSVDRLEIYPPFARVNPGKHMQITAEGKSAFGDTILLYSTFSASPALGVLNPSTPVPSSSSIFTANAVNGAITAEALTGIQSPSVATVAVSVEITAGNLDEECGILSESSPPCIRLESDSKLLIFRGEGAEAPILFPDRIDPREGEESLKTSIHHTSNTAFSGWTIQWGYEGSPDTDTRDLSRFYDDFIRFWFKAQPQLQGKLFVGVRSGNTPAGFEYSKVWLTNYVACDGQWHPVAIPLRVLAGPRPWADLSRIKNLFTIVAVGATQGPANFAIDNLRWGTLRPRFRSIEHMPHGSVQMWLESTRGIQHILERSSDLLNWESISTNTPTTSVFQFLDDSIRPARRSFYRVRTE